jgi:hypothetical protein
MLLALMRELENRVVRKIFLRVGSGRRLEIITYSEAS